jgi:diaminopimelate epimerase
MLLHKAHGLGNDYLVLLEGPPLGPPLVRALCDRHRGVGGDGVLERVAPPAGADLAVRIWNPDGSEAEKSGNGLRIFAWAAASFWGAPSVMHIGTASGTVRASVGPGGVEVEMGRFSRDPAAIPCASPLWGAPLEVGGDTLVVFAVGMGNPHCVVWFPEGTALDALPWRRWGAALEVHPLFPRRTNVQFATSVGPGRLAVRIHERGAGPTLASGSSACAVAVVAAEAMGLGRSFSVEMPGGALAVAVDADGAVRQAGPVCGVGRITLDAAWQEDCLPGVLPGGLAPPPG